MDDLLKVQSVLATSRQCLTFDDIADVSPNMAHAPRACKRLCIRQGTDSIDVAMTKLPEAKLFLLELCKTPLLHQICQYSVPKKQALGYGEA